MDVLLNYFSSSSKFSAPKEQYLEVKLPGLLRVMFVSLFSKDKKLDFSSSFSSKRDLGETRC